MSVNLGALAWFAGPYPTSYLAVHTGPDETFGDEVAGSFAPAVGLVVEGGKNGPPKGLWNEQPGAIVSDIEVDRAVHCQAGPELIVAKKKNFAMYLYYKRYLNKVFFKFEEILTFWTKDTAMHITMSIGPIWRYLRAHCNVHWAS